MGAESSSMKRFSRFRNSRVVWVADRMKRPAWLTCIHKWIAGGFSWLWLTHRKRRPHIFPLFCFIRKMLFSATGDAVEYDSIWFISHSSNQALKTPTHNTHLYTWICCCSHVSQGMKMSALVHTFGDGMNIQDIWISNSSSSLIFSHQIAHLDIHFGAVHTLLVCRAAVILEKEMHAWNPHDIFTPSIHPEQLMLIIVQFTNWLSVRMTGSSRCIHYISSFNFCLSVSDIEWDWKEGEGGGEEEKRWWEGKTMQNK